MCINVTNNGDSVCESLQVSINMIKIQENVKDYQLWRQLLVIKYRTVTPSSGILGNMVG